MEKQGTGDIEMAVRAGLAAAEILAACKGLLAITAEEVGHAGFDIKYLREWLLERPAIARMQAVVANLEGTIAPDEPIFGWPIRGTIHHLSELEVAALKKAGINTIGDLRGYAPEDLIVLPGVGPRGRWAIEYALERSGGIELARPENGPSSDSPLFQMPYGAVLDDWPRTLPDAFERAGIETVGDLLEWTAEDLMGLSGIGEVALACVKEGIQHFGLALAVVHEEEAVAA